MSFGNTSFSNHQAFNTQANHVDTSGRVSAGSFATQLPGGSTLTFSPDGTAIMDMRNSVSNLPASINLGESVRASYAQQAEQYDSAVSSNVNSYGSSKSGELRTMYELGKHLNKLEASGHGWATSENAASGKALNENARLTKDFADRHQMTFDEAANLLTSAYAESRLSGSIGIPAGKFLPINGSKSGSMGHSHTSSHGLATSKGSLYAEAENYIRDTNYANNIESVERAVKDHTFRVNDEEGNRLVDSMGASINEAESARQEMQNNLSQAKTARRMASIASENAESININASQHFMEWLANQRGTNGQGRLGDWGAEAMKNDPSMMQHYAHDYVKQNRLIILTNWSQGMAHTEAEIKGQFHRNDHHINNENDIEKFHQSQRSSIATKAYRDGLIAHQITDQSAISQTEKLLDDNKVKIEQESQHLIRRGEHDMQVAKQEQMKK